MNASLKVLGILAAIAVIGFACMSVHFAKANPACDTLTLTGDISPEIFFAAKDCLVNSSAKEKTFVVTQSGGGNWESALALGILIHRHGWNVEVVDLCASSCANFIFPAGRVKYLHRNALLLFHGGPHQQNLSDQVRTLEADQASAVTNVPVTAKDPGRARMEGRANVDDQSAPRLKVREFLSITDVSSAADLLTKLTNASDRFYEELGVNLQLPTFGQTGRYEPTYKAYKYNGFTYRLDSLRRLGINNIELKDGEWHPERNRMYPDVYEVTYP
jgi:hypothetical protein